MSTENIAYEKRYRDWRAQYDDMFTPENRSSQQDEQFPLTDGYSIRSKAYTYDGDLHLCGSESELLDNEGKVRYAWRNLDTDRSTSNPTSFPFSMKAKGGAVALTAARSSLPESAASAFTVPITSPVQAIAANKTRTCNRFIL